MALVTIKFKNGETKEFKNSLLGGQEIPGLVLVKPDDKDEAYFYNTTEISEILVVKEDEQVTASGIVVVKPNVHLINPKGGK